MPHFSSDLGAQTINRESTSPNGREAHDGDQPLTVETAGTGVNGKEDLVSFTSLQGEISIRREETQRRLTALRERYGTDPNYSWIFNDHNETEAIALNNLHLRVPNPATYAQGRYIAEDADSGIVMLGGKVAQIWDQYAAENPIFFGLIVEIVDIHNTYLVELNNKITQLWSEDKINSAELQALFKEREASPAPEIRAIMKRALKKVYDDLCPKLEAEGLDVNAALIQ